MIDHTRLRRLAEAANQLTFEHIARSSDRNALGFVAGIRNAELMIAANPQTVLALLDEVERLREALGDIEREAAPPIDPTNDDEE